MTFAPPNTRNAFVATSQVFPEDLSQLLITLTQSYITTAVAINAREIAQYQTVEIVTGQLFFNSSNAQDPRLAFRKVFDIGNIATGTGLVLPHGITNITIFTKIYGTCITDVVDYRPIPFSSVAAITGQIQITIDNVNINIQNGATSPNITSGIVVLEYLKT